MATPRLYFVHIPKTGGITLMAYIGDHYAPGECLVVDEWEASTYPSATLERYRLFSGHYAGSVLRALDPRPNVIMCLARAPVARFRSFASHLRRLAPPHRPEALVHTSDLEFMTMPVGIGCYQAYWLARALRPSQPLEVPEASQLPELLAEVDLVGIAEALPRFKQLLSFQLGWPPPPLHWHINKAPDAYDLDAEAMSQIEQRLAVDFELYELARARFTAHYAEMLDALGFSPSDCAAPLAVSLESVQERLRSRHRSLVSGRWTTPVTAFTWNAERRPEGEGWWWRETPKETSYRWSGPEPESRLLLPPLVPGATYDLVVDVMGAADLATWNALTVEVNGMRLDARRERIAPNGSDWPAQRLRAPLPPPTVEESAGPLDVVFRVPETKQSHIHVKVLESFNTENPDLRHLGFAVSRVRVIPSGTDLSEQALMASVVTRTHDAINALPGWLHVNAARTMGALRSAQIWMFPHLRSAVEIGVWEAKSLILLAALTEATDAVVGIDPFCHSPAPDAQFERAMGNIREHVAEADRVNLLRKSSRDVHPDELRPMLSGPLALLHIDGDHTFEGCAADLRLAESIAGHRGALVLVDDIANLSCPGVIEAAIVHLRGDTCFEAVAIAGNKLFLSHRDSAQFYRDSLTLVCEAGLLGDLGTGILAHARRGTALGIPTRFCGAELLVG